MLIDNKHYIKTSSNGKARSDTRQGLGGRVSWPTPHPEVGAGGKVSWPIPHPHTSVGAATSTLNAYDKLLHDNETINHPEPIYRKQTYTALFEQWPSRFRTLEPQPSVYFKLRVSLSLRSSPMMTSETAFYQSINIYTLTCHQNTFISFILLTPSCN
jgi:hypothetical protein